MSTVTGESRRMKFNPRDEPIKTKPAEEGTYELVLKSIGKPGLKGWNVSDDPKKFPYRWLTFEINNTEDETKPGKCKEMRLVNSASTHSFVAQQFHELLRAYGYPDEVDLGEIPASPKDPKVREWCGNFDKYLEWCLNSGKVVKADLNIQEFKGRHNNGIAQWHPAEEFASSMEDNTGTDDEDTSEPKTLDDAEDDSLPPVEAPPKKSKAKLTGNK